MTPIKTDDAMRLKLTLRDGIMLVVGIVGMFSAQLLTQAGMRSDIRDLGTKFENAQQSQSGMNADVQRQIDAARKEAAGARIAADDVLVALAELKGILVGAGIKNIPLTKIGSH